MLKYKNKNKTLKYIKFSFKNKFNMISVTKKDTNQKYLT